MLLRFESLICLLIVASIAVPLKGTAEEWQAFQFYYLVNSTDVSKSLSPISYSIQICEFAVPKANCVTVAKSASYHVGKGDKAIDANLPLRVSRLEIEKAMRLLKLSSKKAIIAAETEGGFQGNFILPLSELVDQGYGSQLLTNLIESDKKSGRVHAMALISSKKTK